MTTSQDGEPYKPEPEPPSIIQKIGQLEKKLPNLPSAATLPFRSQSRSPPAINASTPFLPSGGDETRKKRRKSLTTQSSTTPTRSHDLFNSVSSEQMRQDDYKGIIVQGFSPHVAVLTSPDTDQILFEKGLFGGLLQLLRPFGDQIAGKVTIRDSIGSSKSFEDYGIRFVGLRDNVNYLQSQDRQQSSNSQFNQINGISASAWSPEKDTIRTRPNITSIEEVVEKHLQQHEQEPEEAHSGPDRFQFSSPFHALYMKRLISGLPPSKHETFAHPVACVIAISSRNPSPIEELRGLYASTNTGEFRLPIWVDNEYLRYYLLIHDEDNDDIAKSTVLFDQMKRHFGLHCHLLRLRSTQCVSSDDDSTKLTSSEWQSATEELAEIATKEASGEIEDPASYIFESDHTAVRTFVRGLVTQSVIPFMERQCAKWNEHILSKRRGISGRFMSLSKRLTPFSSVRSTSGIGSSHSSSGNYETLQGFYKADTPEAIMRKLADFSFILRDYKLAQSTYELLRGDFNNDKAWKHYAAANEMTAISLLLTTQVASSKIRIELVDQMFEAASYSYVTRCSSQYYALRTLTLGSELLRIRGSKGAIEAARWASRINEMKLVGPYGEALLNERIVNYFMSVRGLGALNLGERARKSAFWAALAAEAWLNLDKTKQARKCFSEAEKLYGLYDDKVEGVAFDKIHSRLNSLSASIASAEDDSRGGGAFSVDMDENTAEVEEVSEKIDQRPHRKSLIGLPTAYGQPGAVPITPIRSLESPVNNRDDKFE